MKEEDYGILVRVSTDYQVESGSYDNHEERARMYAEMKGWNVKTVYNLGGVSGKDVMGHPETQRMLNDIRRGYIKGIIFSKIARLARNTKQLLEISEIFKQYNASLVSITENIDTSTPAGYMFFTIVGALAQWERETIATRVKESIYVRAKNGKNIGGRGQFGFKWKDGELMLDEKEAPIRKLMYELFLQEGRKTSVANILNERGYRTRSGAKFSRSVVKRWLRDPISKGLRRANYTETDPNTKAVETKPQDEWFLHPCPAIVSKELWQEVNDILDKQDSMRKPVLNRKVHIFTNYIFCHCGSRMNVRSRLTHYKCTSGDCNNKILRSDLNEAFKSRLTQFLSNSNEIEKYFSSIQKDADKQKNRLEILKLSQSECEEKIEKLLDLHIKGQIPTEAFNEYHKAPYEQLIQIKEQIVILENQIKQEVHSKKFQEKIISESKGVYIKWDEYERDKKREIIEAVLETVTIGKDTIDFTLKRMAPAHSFELGKMGDKTDFNHIAPPLIRRSH